MRTAGNVPYNLTRVVTACLKRYRETLGTRAKEARRLLRAPAYLYCDEYLSIITTRTLGEMVRGLSPVEKRSTYILASFGAQRAYRRIRYPDSMPSKDGDNELPVFRWSVLKKYVDMPLFLLVRRHSGNSLLVHILYSLIAAVAMSLALAVTFVWEDADFFSAPIFVIAVFAYICRERIKDVLRGKMISLFREVDTRSRPAGERQLRAAARHLCRAVPFRCMGQAPQGRARPAQPYAFRGYPQCLP
ncbi:MAG: hypothetical protein V8Q84_00505 [Bilophila sp.]